MKTIKLYWWQGEGNKDESQRNFGDYLSPLIVEMVSGKKVKHAHPKDADMLAIGTILFEERKAKNWIFKRKLHIWGSGTDRINRSFSQRHHYHAVRGFKSKDQIETFYQDLPVGDPGLLADKWADGKKPEKKYTLGIIPHYVDKTDPRISELKKIEKTKIINVFDSVQQVLHDIQQCDFILSSSMHGLIVADSFGIPNRRLVMSHGIISDYKFHDYYSAFALAEPRPVTPEECLQHSAHLTLMEEEYTRPGIESIKDGLINSFPHNI